MRIVDSVVSVNAARKKKMADRVVEVCGGDVKGKTIAVLGTTFKPNTDDMRESPSLDIIPALQSKGAVVKAYDPAGMAEAKKLLSSVEWCADSYTALKGADAVVLVTEWNEFRSLDLERVKSLMKRPIMVDLRNVYDPGTMIEAGFTYKSIGRSNAAPHKS
jgi:UDPglucose 6-dehydrogenase